MKLNHRDMLHQPPDADSLVQDWVPYKLAHQEQWLCHWLSLTEERYGEPFFADTIQKCRTNVANRKPFTCLSTLDFLVSSSSRITSVRPSAFIFHVSRCGSTLLSQMLGMSLRHIVLSEVPLIDELLRLPLKDKDISYSVIEAALRACIAWLGRQRNDETHLFIKLDSWHVFFAPFIRKLYPDVPFVLLYRTPDEVVRSHQARRGMQAVPGLIEPELFAFPPYAEQYLDADVYMGRVLAYYFSRFAQIAAQDKHAVLIDYRQGSKEIIQQLAARTGLILSDAEKEAIEMRSRFHSKYPEQIFSEPKHETAIPDYLIQAQALYKQLEQMRLRGDV